MGNQSALTSAGKKKGTCAGCVIFGVLAVICAALGVLFTNVYLQNLHDNPSGTEVAVDAILWFFQVFLFSIPLLIGVIFSVVSMVLGIGCRRSASRGVRVTGIVFSVFCPLLAVGCVSLILYSALVF